MLVLVRVKKVKILKPSYFVSGVVGTFVGFPRHKRVVDGFARCLLCKADLSIAGRGLSSLWEHWRGVEQTRLEQKYRIMMQMPLLDKACRPVTAEEDRRIRQDRMNEPFVYLGSELSLSVDERIAIEEAEASSSERPALSAESVFFLWLSFSQQFRERDVFRRSHANGGVVAGQHEYAITGRMSFFDISAMSGTYAILLVKIYHVSGLDICCSCDSFRRKDKKGGKGGYVVRAFRFVNGGVEV